MSKQKWDASSLRLVLQYLRVPELFYPYELGTSDAAVEKEKQIKQLLSACVLSEGKHEASLIVEVQKQFAEKGTFSQANNLAFLIDRTFDVWLRKNAFHTEVTSVLSNWRFLLYKLLMFSQRAGVGQAQLKTIEHSVSDFVDMLESIAVYAQQWEPVPKRSKSILLDQLKLVETTFDARSEFDDELVKTCSQQWFEFLQKQNLKVVKISERFVISEAKKNKADYSVWLACHYLNVLFKKRNLPHVLQRFLQEYWIFVVAKEIEKTLPDDLTSKEAIVVGSYNESLDLLCKNIVRVFCHRGESGFQLADQIIDDLQKAFQDTGISGNIQFAEGYSAQSTFYSIDEAWDALSECLLAMLQGKEEGVLHTFTLLSIPEHHKQAFGGIEQFKSSAISFVELKIKQAEWFVLEDEEGVKLLKFVSNIDQSHQLLFSNYLGMKSAQLSYQQFKDKSDKGSLKKLTKCIAFSTVFDQAIKGLAKIAENQKRTRLIAAEKAKAEAERLLEDRRKADELANNRAEEIALRTRQLKEKREDKLRLEKETVVINIIRAFNLGAWIAIQEEGEPQRFKLVVKLAATGKYVFVDRLGIKKREYMEPELMQAILSKQIEVLTDGAEFEDSLQRVVSRLRMSK